MFQTAFKYYKARKPPPSFENVLIVGDDSYPFQAIEANLTGGTWDAASFRPVQEWRIFEVATRPGLFVIANPFTPAGQRHWMAASLIDYPAHPNTTNLSATQGDNSSIGNGWWQTLSTMSNSLDRRKFASTLRWSTLGYQYDWSNKVYAESRKQSFPPDLAQLVRTIASVLGFERFSPEAAIVNYYPTGTTLAGHTDHSEDDLTAPLLSLSFGQPAVFLIGGTSRDERPDAILLRSGDVLAMTGASRQCYHAVPRVFSDSELPEGVGKCIDRWKRTIYNTSQTDPMCENDWSLIDDYVQHCRININVRQVLKENQQALDGSANAGVS
ncbi:AGAP000155-PA-like protein [Anopheles sinensis]|uniref:AGAP000155-PA-like protein n=1 Tax=Anopheles sinensis TaxID=74873 RepID=A0A084WFN9_ANOSI|nr:AGAP000155-PA-like protein [Anopheles sinensis]